MKKSVSIVLLATILLQSCVAYQKTSVSLNEATNKGKVKLIDANGRVYAALNIEMQDSIYYGFIAKEKIVISEASLSEIYLQDKKKSAWMTVLGITIPIVVYPAPIADFTSDTACAQSPTQFTDLSISNYGAINSWSWTFGDGGVSSQQNPAYTYASAGTYPVTLIIQTVGGCSDTASGFAEVYPLPIASFSTTPVCDEDTMYFTDLSVANSGSISSWL